MSIKNVKKYLSSEIKAFAESSKGYTDLSYKIYEYALIIQTDYVNIAWKRS